MRYLLKNTAYMGMFLALLMSVEISSGATKGCGDKRQFNCMVATINGEARGESYEGKLVVGKSLKTRKIRGYVGGSICGISAQSYAPQPMSSRLPKKIKADILKAATVSCASGDAGYTHFHSFRKKNATSWSKSRQFKYIGKVGGHWLFNGGKYVKANFGDYFLTEVDVIFPEDYLDQVSDDDIVQIYNEQDEIEAEQALEEGLINTVDI